MIGHVAGTTTLLEKFKSSSHKTSHKSSQNIHQESLCVKTLNLQTVKLPVVKCVNKTTARALDTREFREYCEILDLEYGALNSIVRCAGFLEDRC